MKTVGSGVAADLQKMMEQKHDGAQAPLACGEKDHRQQGFGKLKTNPIEAKG